MLSKTALIVTIALVLLVGVFLIFNPLERLRETRDALRVKDLTSLKSAVDTYINNNAKEIAASSALLCSGCSAGNQAFSYRKITLGNISTIEKKLNFVNGTGWIPLDLAKNAKLGQTPLQILPTDPLEKGFQVRTKLPIFTTSEDFVYVYTAGIDNKYKISAKMESQKGLDKASHDGGSASDRLEVGTDLSLLP